MNNERSSLDDKFDFLIKEYESFLNSISRFKWVILITLLLSCSVLVDLYSSYGISSSQLNDVVRRRVVVDLLAEVLKEKEKSKVSSSDIAKMIQSLDVCSDKSKLKDDFCVNNSSNDPVAMTLHQVSDFIIRKLMLKDMFLEFNNDSQKAEVEKAYNLIKEYIPKLEEVSEIWEYGDYNLKNQINKRTLPLLNMDVGSNDFLSIIQLMLMLFVIALWLVLENIKFQIFNLLKYFNKVNDGIKLRILIKSNFLFNVSKRSQEITNGIQFIALFFPAFSILIATYFDLEPLVSCFLKDDICYGYGSEFSQIIRMIIGFISAMAISVFSFMSYKVSKEIDRKINEIDSPLAKNFYGLC